MPVTALSSYDQNIANKLNGPADETDKLFTRLFSRQAMQIKPVLYLHLASRKRRAEDLSIPVIPTNSEISWLCFRR